ncbi:MAG: DNA-directed RNA polymerase subunit A' [Thermoprotei archaeon]|jgi:DNA-directed RNA polymerase subunit A'
MSLSDKKIVRGIKFGLLSPEKIVKQAVVEINSPETYDQDGLPVPGGLMDRRLGTVEPSQRCETCGARAGKCPGHFGYIRLERPVIHPGLAKKIHETLSSVCRECGRIKLPDEELESYKKQMKDLEGRNPNLAKALSKVIVKKASSVYTCPHCGATNYPIEYERPTTFYEQTGGKKGEASSLVRIPPTEIRIRLEKISDDEARLLGWDPEVARPEWSVLTYLPVPPISMRPAITLETGLRSEDDLTHKLVDILRANEKLKEHISSGAPQSVIDDVWELLQYHVITYFDNETQGAPSSRHRSGRPLRTLAQRLKGKEGRFRGNLLGKRVDFSSRSVISPDPWIGVDEVGVPIQVARILTIPERVTELNLDEMKELVRRGPNNYPGANYVIRPNGVMIDLRYVKDTNEIADELGVGFTVERHLKDGDVVLFNRQPSLHRPSIMGHIVRVLPYRTFRLNPAVCPPYNADFDGDEMNLHVPQGKEAEAEAKEILLVEKNILSPRFGGPLMGAIQDFISGAYLLTKKSVLLDRDEVMDLLYAGNYEGPLPPPIVTSPRPLWTGKQIVSLFIPKKVNYSSKANSCVGCGDCSFDDCPGDGFVYVKNGDLLMGVLDKKSIGATVPNSLLHRIVKDVGNEAGRDFMDKAFKVFLRFSEWNGFTVGLKDLEIPATVREAMKKRIAEVEREIDEAIGAYERGEVEAEAGKTAEEEIEDMIMSRLTKLRDEVGDMATRNMDRSSHSYIMALTGARGSVLNLTQISAIVGQQASRGGRIVRGYSDRTLPVFDHGDMSARGRGFVESSFYEGLNPVEFFFHAVTGREGLVDTAVRTSQSGYMQRRLIHALEDLHVEYDGSVRGAEGELIQVRYGDDGVDPAKSDHGIAEDVDRIIDEVLQEVK